VSSWYRTTLAYPLLRCRISGVACAKPADPYGSMGGDALDPAGVKVVAAMPSRDELLSQIAGALGGPASDIAAALGGPASTIASILTTIEERAEAA